MEIQFVLPDIRTSPSLASVQSAIDKVAEGILDVGKNIQWWAKDTNKTFYSSLLSEDIIVNVKKKISDIAFGECP